jgi:hypothetical protein
LIFDVQIFNKQTGETVHINYPLVAGITAAVLVILYVLYFIFFMDDDKQVRAFRRWKHRFVAVIKLPEKLAGVWILANMVPILLNGLVVYYAGYYLLYLGFYSLMALPFEFSTTNLLQTVGGLGFGFVLYRVVFHSFRDRVEIKAANPPQRGYVVGLMGFIPWAIKYPGRYIGFPILYEIKAVDVVPDDADIVIDRVYCTDVADETFGSPDELPDTDAKTRLDLKATPEGKQIVAVIKGKIQVTFVVDDSSQKGLQKYVENGAGEVDSNEFAKARVGELVNEVINMAGRFLPWQFMVQSPEMLKLWIIQRITCISRKNFWTTVQKYHHLIKKSPELHKQLKQLQSSGADLSEEEISAQDFVRYMGEIGFRDENGLGIRIVKVTVNLQASREIEDAAQEIGIEQLQRKSDELNITTMLRLVDQAMERGMSPDEASRFVLLNTKGRNASELVVSTPGGGGNNPVVVAQPPQPQQQRRRRDRNES